MVNFLANVIINLFNVVPLVKPLGTFIVSANSFIEGNNLTISMFTNLINIYNSFTCISISAKLFIHAVIVFVGSTTKVGVIANLCNVGLAVNPLISLSPFITFANSFVKASSVANLKAANPTIDIYNNFILASTSAKSFINISVIFISSTVDAGIVSNLSIDVLSTIKLFPKLVPNTTYKK